MKDPMIQEKIHADVERVQDQVMKKLKMNGLVQADDDVSIKIDETLASIPVSRNKDGSFSRRSSVASRQQFNALGNMCAVRSATSGSLFWTETRQWRLMSLEKERLYLLSVYYSVRI